MQMGKQKLTNTYTLENKLPEDIVFIGENLKTFLTRLRMTTNMNSIN